MWKGTLALDLVEDLVEPHLGIFPKFFGRMWASTLRFLQLLEKLPDSQGKHKWSDIGTNNLQVQHCVSDAPATFRLAVHALQIKKCFLYVDGIILLPVLPGPSSGSW